MTNPDIIGTTVKALQEHARSLGLTWSLRPGTVTSVDGGVLVTLDGDAAIISAVNLLDFVSIGDRVMIISVPPSGNFIVGLVGGVSAAGVLNDSSTAAGGTTSATFTFMPGTPFVTFTKRREGSDLVVQMYTTWYTTAVTTSAEFGVNINGVDYAIMGRFVNPANTHELASGVNVISGIPAGTHAAFLMWRRTSGAGTLTQDTADTISCFITETAI